MGNFSDMLAYLRKREGLSQQDLAYDLGVAKSTISMYENGQRKPSFEMLELIADYFNVNMDTLLGTNKQAHPTTEDGAPINIVRIAGRDGSYEEKRLNDRELQALKAFVDLLPDAPDDL